MPLMPFADVAGSTGTEPPVQIEIVVPKLKVGIIVGVTVTANVVGIAHCSKAGVKVYVAEI